jgi:hypothetical protein
MELGKKHYIHLGSATGRVIMAMEVVNTIRIRR